MNVCMLIYNYWPMNAGGAENQCRRLVHHFAGSDTRCTVATGRHDINVPEQEKDNGTAICRLATFETILQRLGLQKPPQRDILAENSRHFSPDGGRDALLAILPKSSKTQIAALAAICVRYLNILVFGCNTARFLFLKRSEISVIHVHGADHTAGLASLIGHLLKIPVICKGTNLPVFPALQRAIPFSKQLDRWRKRCYFIALTEAMKNELIDEGVSSGKIHLIPNGVNVPPTTGDPENNSTFLMVGNFSQTAAHKAFDVLIDAWRIVVAHEPTAHLVMVGGGDSRQWRQLICHYGIQSTVTFAGYQTDLENYYRHAGVFVLPSRREGISNALLEAQSYGIPAIVSDIPGNRFVVIDGITGAVVPVGKSTDLAEAMLRFFRTPDLRRACGQAARKRVEKVFSMTNVTSDLARLYREIVV